MAHPKIIAPPIEAWNICVMTRGETYFATTEGAIRGFGNIAPGAFWDTGKLLDEISVAFGERAEGLLLVPVLPGGGDDDPGESLASRWAAMENSAFRAGWRVTGDEALSRDTGWATFRHMEHGQRIHMGILTMIDESRTPLFDIAGTAGPIADALVTYASVTGVLWRMSAGVSGCASLRRDRAERAAVQLTLPELTADPDAGQPWWRWDKAPRDIHGAGHIIWSRPLVPAEKVPDARIVTYDVRAQFLAAMVGGDFGWGEPHQRLRVPFDPKRAGFWKIASSGPLSLSGPPLVRHLEGFTGLTWVTTPVMVYLLDMGIEPMVYDSWTSATSSQWLKPWAVKLRDALYAQSEKIQTIEKALKRTYAETNGMFNVAGGSVYRKDVHWTTIDLATMNLRRKIDHVHATIGVWPCEIYHDAVSYPVADEEAFTELNTALGVKWPVGKGERISIGKFKYKGATTVEAWEARQAKKERTK